MLLCIRDNFEMTPAPEDTSLQAGAVAESFMNVLFQHGRLRCRQHLHWRVIDCVRPDRASAQDAPSCPVTTLLL